MKYLLLNVLVITLFSTSSFAQTPEHPWTLSLSSNAVDFYEEEFFSFKNIDRTNLVSIISKATVGRHIYKDFSGSLSATINTIDNIRFGAAAASNYNVRIEPQTYFSIDGAINYSLRNLISKTGDSFIDPKLSLGGSFFKLESEGFFSANGGLNLDFWLRDNFAITFGSIYKHALGNANTYEAELINSEETIEFNTSHFQHNLGFKVGFDNNDADGDGVPNKKDECPLIPGPAELNGCPDTDGDGINDFYDSCPEEAGLKVNNGCPDKDGDGLSDRIDMCPEIAGPKINRGCPIIDTDGDGIVDKADKCPEVPGPASNYGCPEEVELEKDINEELDQYKNKILFEEGKAEIKGNTEEILIQVLNIMNQFPNSSFRIDGHTDSIDTDEYNQKLSESRANKVMQFLINQGVSEERLSFKGFGETTPIGDNKTIDGRSLNRRVEITVQNISF